MDDPTITPKLIIMIFVLDYDYEIITYVVGAHVRCDPSLGTNKLSKVSTLTNL